MKTLIKMKTPIKTKTRKKINDFAKAASYILLITVTAEASSKVMDIPDFKFTVLALYLVVTLTLVGIFTE